jgi:hypothetical protein
MPRETQHIEEIERRFAATQSTSAVQLAQRRGVSAAMFGARVGAVEFAAASHEKRSLHEADCSTLVTFLFAPPLGKSC